jgi:translation initiation factor IF-2
MEKIRVYELAKKLGTPSKRLLAELKALGIDVKSNLSVLDESALRKLQGKPELKSNKSAEAKGRGAKEAPAKNASKGKGKVKPEPVVPKGAKGKQSRAAVPPKKEAPAAPVAQPPQKAPPAKAGARPAPPRTQLLDGRRRTKRERRMAKVAAKEDRRQRLLAELEEARATAASGEAIFIREGITVKELADKMSVKVRDIIAKLMMRNILVTINQPLDAEVAVEVCVMFGFAAEVISYEDEMVLDQEEIPMGDKPPRAPVVTVMGHVDHGKSTLLEAIHSVDITSKEFGGITQHIGAYKVKKGDREWAFVDTPGHKAFTLMRARGAQVTDIVILVVAADDSVMPQTVEAINHCKAAGAPMIVAINKMDKPGADPDHVKKDLSQHGILTEDWGGEVVSVNVSAKTGEGIDDLLDMVSIVAEMLDLRASRETLSTGTNLESRLDRARGPVATVLIQEGTIHVGDLFLCGATFGRVRGLFDDKGRRVNEAGPSTPVEILGFSEVPAVGALFQGMDEEAKARQVASFRKEQAKAKNLRVTRVTLDNVFGAIQKGELQALPIVLKADVQGSLEAVAAQMLDLTTEEVKIDIVHKGAGAISESDILLATASNALVLGFNVRPDRKATEVAKSEGVDIELFTVIYDLVDRMKQALTGMLRPIEKEVILGHVEVKQVFKISKIGTIAGSIVTDGKATSTALARLLRDNVVIHTGKIGSLKHYKDDISEAKDGTECGIGLVGYNDIKPGDVFEVFEIQHEERTLEDSEKADVKGKT